MILFMSAIKSILNFLGSEYVIRKLNFHFHHFYIKIIRIIIIRIMIIRIIIIRIIVKLVRRTPLYSLVNNYRPRL